MPRAHAGRIHAHEPFWVIPLDWLPVEKGRIIKPNRPIICGPRVPQDVLHKFALQEKGLVNMILVMNWFHHRRRHRRRQPTPTSSTTTSSTTQADFLEDYDQENARIAKAALDQ